ncbi:MAG: hypothetical protein H0V81_11505, partial [Solirubrobacterales bacterium]|nr:hypothetical protein [Solirubrobacterales bacterium]
RFSESFNVRGGYFGSVSVNPRTSSALGVSADPSSRFATGDGTYFYDLVVDPGTSVGINTVTVRARPSGATAAELDTAFRVSPVTIAAVTPASFVRTSPGAPLRQVQVRGHFPAACAITFQDGAGQAWPITRRDGVDVDGTNFDLWTLDVPQGAVSGPLRALSPTGAEVARSAPVDVTDFRNVFALAGLNGGAGARTNAYTWADFERTFGDDDTESCFIVCVTDDHARTYYRRWRDQVQANPGTGLCSGWVQMALRFKRGTQLASEYLPAATRAWQIPSTQVDGTAVKRDIVRWQVAQFDKGFQEDRTRGFARSAADERAVIKQGVAGGDVYIGIRQGTAGHAVLGYDAQDITTPTGPGLIVQIYDPNVPYTTAEETSGAVRTAAVAGSTITIQGDGSWAGSGFPWAGNNGTLMATTALPADNAELPTSAGFVVSLFSSAAGGGTTPAEITSIDAGGRPTLGPGGEPRPGSGVTLRPNFSGVGAVPEYGLQAGREYELTATGKGGGTYEHGLIGGGSSATVAGAPTAPGQKDTLTVRPGQAQLGFATGGAGGPVSYELTDQNGRATRSAEVATRAGKGADDEAELAGGTLRVRHDGPPVSMSITLRSSGEGLPGAVTTAPIRLGAGERLELRPQAWKDLQAGVRLTVRDRRGRVKRRSAARLRGTRRIALGAIKARRSGTRVTVSGRVAKRGSEPVLFALVEQLRGGRVVARKGVTRRATQVRKGRFSLPVKVGRVRAGTRLRATVTLVDDTGERVSVRKRVAVR